MNASSGLFAASAWSWLWAALVIERASAVAGSPIRAWAATRGRAINPLWGAATQRSADIGLAALCMLHLETAPPLEGLIGLQPAGLTTGLSALAMAGFIDLWRRVLSWPGRYVARPPTPGLSLSSSPAEVTQNPLLLPHTTPERRGFRLGSLSLHRSEP
ncbi:hypothetical protein [Ideonella sp.]|uniref:hypothetical protein n=1 Tax=Ideonella sp. TaxID=1929293 RepID=UPI0037C11165